MKPPTTPSTKASRFGSSAAATLWHTRAAASRRTVGRALARLRALPRQRIRNDVPALRVLLLRRRPRPLRHAEFSRAARHAQDDHLPVGLWREIAHRRRLRGRRQKVVPQFLACSQIERAEVAI